MDPQLKKASLQGLADAIGFVVGALAGWKFGAWLGYDFINTPPGTSAYALPQLIGLALILLGCGLGRWLARRLILGTNA